MLSIANDGGGGVAVQLEPTGVRFAGDGVTLAADRWDAVGARRGVVLLLHGGGQTRHSWRTTGRDLADRGWTAITLDSRGHGESDWAADGDYSIDSMIADLRSVVATLDEAPVLVGASMGGMTAMVAQGEDPGLARAVVLVDVAPRMEPDGTAEIVAFMRSGVESGFASLDEAADAVAAYNPQRARPARPDGLRKNLRERDGRWYWHWDPRMFAAGTGERSTVDRLGTRARTAGRRITVPTLLVRGRESRVVSEDGAQELLALVPGSRMVDVGGAGHMVAGDDNDVFGAHLLAFLDQLDA